MRANRARGNCIGSDKNFGLGIKRDGKLLEGFEWGAGRHD